MSIYSVKQSQRIVLVITIGLGLFLGAHLLGFLPAIVGALIIYVIFRSLHIRLTESHGWPVGGSAALIMVSSFLLLVLPFAVLSWQVVEQVLYFNEHPEELMEIVNKIVQVTGVDFGLEEILDKLLTRIQSDGISMFTGAFNTFMNILITISLLYFLLYYMLVNWKTFEDSFSKYLPFKQDDREKFANELKNITFSNVVGQGLISLVQASLIIILFLVLGINEPFLWGLMAFFLSFIPFIGTPFVFVPAGLIQIANGDMTSGIIAIVFGFLVVTNIDNLMRMFMNKKLANTHPVVTILGILIGIPAFGILGLVVGPLLVSYFVLMVKIFEKRQAQRERRRVEKESKKAKHFEHDAIEKSKDWKKSEKDRDLY